MGPFESHSSGVEAMPVALPPRAPAVETVTSVAAYESMCRWIAESESLAECKDIADKAAALKEYARRIKNTEAERRAVNVRLIAERQYGALLQQLARATPQTANPTGKKREQADETNPSPGAGSGSPPLTPYAKALSETGVSSQAASRYQALAAVPQETFDEAIRDPVATPTVRALVENARNPVPQLPTDVLWLWGRMRDFERDGYFTRDDLAAMFDAMTESMQRDAIRIAPLMTDFFQRFQEVAR